MNLRNNQGWETAEEPAYLDNIITCTLPKIEQKTIESKSHRIKQIPQNQLLKSQRTMDPIQNHRATQSISQTVQTISQSTMTAGFYYPLASTKSFHRLRFIPKAESPSKGMNASQSPYKLKRMKCSIVNFSQISMQSPKSEKQLSDLNRILQRFTKKKYLQN